MEYSVSTFGDIPFDQEVNVQLIMAPEDDPEGCGLLQKPANLKAEKFVWFVTRGGSGFFNSNLKASART